MTQVQAAQPAPPHGGAGYRPDIDGLRGLGMLAAICFHASLPGAGGGFTAIDMFFVISGFVITRMIMGQQAAGKFRLRTFYIRRILRLVPATVPVLVLTSLLCGLLMTEQEFATYFRSLVAMLFFYANFFFYFLTNYFNPFAETQPLLHAWSLSAEEQFYLLWPIAMLCGALWFRRSVNLALMIAVLVASLALMLWLHPERANAGYYLLPARLWQIMAGVILAYLNPFHLKPLTRSLLAGAGVVTLLGSFFLVSPVGGYPNITALIPVLATMAIIIAADFPPDADARPSFANRLLSAAPIVWIGLISYSIYLWHWPILTLVRLAEVFPLHVGWRAALMLLAIPVAWASYVWVERPMRALSSHPKAGLIATSVFLGSITVSLLAGYGASLVNSALRTAPERIATAIAEQDRRATEAEGCHSWPVDAPVPDCRTAPAGAPRAEWLLIGDSHADAIGKDLAAALAPRGIALTRLSQSSCPTAAGVETWVPVASVTTTDCAAANRRIVNEVLGERRIDTLVIASHWPIYGRSPMWEGIPAILMDGGEPVALEPRLRQFLDAVRQRHGSRVRVVLLSPIPVPGVDVPLCALRSLRLQRPVDRCLSQSAQAHAANIADSEAMVARVAAASGAEIVDAAAPFCDADQCRFGDDTALWWRDDRHLSRQGSAMLAASLVRQLGIAPLP